MASPLIIRTKQEIALKRDNLIISIGCGILLAALCVSFFI